MTYTMAPPFHKGDRVTVTRGSATGRPGTIQYEPVWFVGRPWCVYVYLDRDGEIHPSFLAYLPAEQVELRPPTMAPLCRHLSKEGCYHCCETCNRDLHRCPRCGAPLLHAQTVCLNCEKELTIVQYDMQDAYPREVVDDQ